MLAGDRRVVEGDGLLFAVYRFELIQRFDGDRRRLRIRLDEGGRVAFEARHASDDMAVVALFKCLDESFLVDFGSSSESDPLRLVGILVSGESDILEMFRALLKADVAQLSHP